MYSETLPTGHHVSWSHPASERTAWLVLMLHDADSTPAAMESYVAYLPDGATGLAVTAGFESAPQRAARAAQHRWFTTDDANHPNFAELMSVAHRTFDAVDDDEFGTTSFSRIDVLGVGQGAALATTMLRIRPEAITSVIGIGGYVVDHPMLTALDAATLNTKPVLWVGGSDHPTAESSRQWLTTHTRFTEAKTPSAITPFLQQNVS